ncbi:MAG: HD domain-containing protein [Promethearchaeota archaeon]
MKILIQWEKKALNDVIDYVKSNMEMDDVHGFNHVARVVALAKLIYKKEIHRRNYDDHGEDKSIKSTEPPIDFNVLIFAAWLHDVGRAFEFQRKQHHAIISAEMSEEFLKELAQKYEFIDDTFIEKVKLCILNHSFSFQKEINRNEISEEGKILSDADKLDALGAVGIYRASAFQDRAGTGISGFLSHYKEKLSKLDEKLYTDSAKIIAKERKDILDKFARQLTTEIRMKSLE